MNSWYHILLCELGPSTLVSNGVRVKCYGCNVEDILHSSTPGWSERARCGWNSYSLRVHLRSDLHVPHPTVHSSLNHLTLHRKYRRSNIRLFTSLHSCHAATIITAFNTLSNISSDRMRRWNKCWRSLSSTQQAVCVNLHLKFHDICFYGNRHCFESAWRSNDLTYPTLLTALCVF